jgi:hypothetical protein
MADCTTPLGRPEKSVEWPKLVEAGSITVLSPPNPFNDNDDEYIKLIKIIIFINIFIVNEQSLDRHYS